MDTSFNRLFEELLVQQRFDFEGYVTENHREGERFQGASTRSRLVPPTFRVVNFGEYDVEGALGDVCIFLTPRSNGQLAEGNHGEGIGEDIVRLYQGTTFAVEGEIPVQVAVVAVLLEKFCTLDSAVKPFLALLYFIIERGEHPHFAALHPDKLVGIVDRTVSVKAGEVAAELFVL